MHARIGAPASRDVYLVPDDRSHGLLERLADRDGVFLHLPAVIGRAVVFEKQSDVAHMGSPIAVL